MTVPLWWGSGYFLELYNVEHSFSNSEVNSDKQANIIAMGILNSVKTALLSKRQDKIKVF